MSALSIRRHRDAAKFHRNLNLPIALLYLPHQEGIQGQVFMETDALQAGDWVRAASGQTGKIILVSRLSAFVEVQQDERTRTTSTFLLSELTKIEPPPSSTEAPHQPR